MKKILRILAVLTVVLMLAGCGSAYEKERAADSGYDMSPSSGSSNSLSLPLAGQDDPDAKIVWTGSVWMQTTDWDKTLEDLRNIVKEYGVEILSAEEEGGTAYARYSVRSDTKRASYELRVPSDKFADFFDAFSSVNGTVISSEKSRADMTRAYNDNALKISLLQTEYDELKALMAKADTVEEVLSIRDRMTSVLFELESLNKANNQIDYDVAWSSVSLSLEEVLVYTEAGAGFFDRAKVAFVNGWIGFVNAIQDICVFLLMALPWLLLTGGIAVLIAALVRRGKKKRRARQDDRTRQQGQPPRV